MSTYAYTGNSAGRTVDANSVRPINSTAYFKAG